MSKVLFLDIDGVLNGADVFGQQWPVALIEPRCVQHLNAVVQRTQCKLVLSSSWRYMICDESMTLKGFGHLLKTHGVIGDLIGFTCRDDECDERGDQILQWVLEHKPSVFAVVDDVSCGMDAISARLVKTDGCIGLTEQDADRLVALLGEVDSGDVVEQRRLLLHDIAASPVNNLTP